MYLPEDIYEQLKSERQKLVKPIVLTDEQFKQRWQDQPYPRKPISDEVPFFETMRGERVRSKSEVIIADRLYLKKIPYKYECPLIVDGKIIHPDFTILDDRNRRELYLEHLGMLSDPIYLTRAIRKVNEYNRSGFCLGSRLLVTMESSDDTIDIKATEIMILNALGSTP